jgi:hypothetical protein
MDSRDCRVHSSSSSSSSSSSHTLSARLYYGRYAGGAGLRGASVPNYLYTPERQ